MENHNTFNFDNVKCKDSDTSSRFFHLGNITKLFRIVEFVLILVFLVWVSTQVPFAVKISGEYFRQLVAVVISPLFIFLLGNVIVLTLVFKSGHLFPQKINDAEMDFCQEFIKNTENELCFDEPEEIVYQDKQTIFEANNVNEVKVERSLSNLEEGVRGKVHRRTRSESSKRDDEVGGGTKQLRRMGTEKCRRVADSGEVLAATVDFVDELSNEEFQRAVDAFIAKQIKLHKEENLSIVLHSHNKTECVEINDEN